MINKKQLGFTLIELVVAIGVFLSLFLIVIVNFRSGESINELKLETQKIASDIRKVQTLALTGSNYNLSTVGAGGYGIVFRAGIFTYNMFKDVNENGIYDDGDALLETRALAQDINSLVFVGSYSTVNIVFKPYSSELSVDADGTVLTDEVEINILHSRATGKKGVIGITPVSGKIDFKME